MQGTSGDDYRRDNDDDDNEDQGSPLDNVHLYDEQVERWNKSQNEQRSNGWTRFTYVRRSGKGEGHRYYNYVVPDGSPKPRNRIRSIPDIGRYLLEHPEVRRPVWASLGTSEEETPPDHPGYPFLPLRQPVVIPFVKVERDRSPVNEPEQGKQRAHATGRVDRGRSEDFLS